jgi:hypothetical protein
MKKIIVLSLSLLCLFSGFLSAQETPTQGPDSEFQFTQLVGAQYSSKTGFIPTYRVELSGSLVRSEGVMVEGKLTNDFAVLGDLLSTSLTARYAITPQLGVSLEVPASLIYRYPTDLTATIAGTAKLSLSNRNDSRDQSTGWVFGSEISYTATESWTNTTMPITLGSNQLGVVIPYQAGGQIHVGYVDSFFSPDLKVGTTYDLSTQSLIDITSTLGLNFKLGSPEQTLSLSAATSLFSKLGDTKFVSQLNWDHIIGSVSLGSNQVQPVPMVDYVISLAYKF